MIKQLHAQSKAIAPHCVASLTMLQVKFCNEIISERLSQILSEFPLLDQLHPFLSSLLNVLYDKNHYKLALGQINTCKHLVGPSDLDFGRDSPQFSVAEIGIHRLCRSRLCSPVEIRRLFVSVRNG